jgi:hypothetical protein
MESLAVMRKFVCEDKTKENSERCTERKISNKNQSCYHDDIAREKQAIGCCEKLNKIYIHHHLLMVAEASLKKTNL